MDSCAYAHGALCSRMCHRKRIVPKLKELRTQLERKGMGGRKGEWKGEEERGRGKGEEEEERERNNINIV